MKLLLATNNAHKLGELAAHLGPLGIEVVSPGTVGGLPPVDEDRDTFAGNAVKKAVSGARASGLWTLADDSGLEVDHLDGAPGVRSARYAGEPCDDGANNAKLLEALAGVPAAGRGARFVAALALAEPGGRVVLAVEGTVRGRILESPRGTGGFGYDPLFEYGEAEGPVGRTFAEIGSEAKGAVSHRGRALAELSRRLPALLEAAAAE